MTDARSCGGMNDIAGIPFFTAASSAFLGLGTTILHACILYSIIKDWRNKFKYFFYKLLLNISVADLMCGLGTDPYSTIFHIQEGLHSKHLELKVIHVMLYLFGTVPLATLILLCIDRTLTLLRPMTYRKGLQGWQSWLTILCTWSISGLQIMAYFDLGFIAYLVIFASVNIAGTSLAMIITTIIYRNNFGNANKCRTSLQNESNSNSDAKKSMKTSELRRRKERTATKTFIIMSVVTILSYLPTCFATGYTNTCRNCNCTIVHTWRDVAFITILAGPFFRAVNLLVCLKPLRPKIAMLRRLSSSNAVAESPGRPTRSST